MKENKFIVISPCYNVAPYIDKCVMSVVNQEYDNFEYIVVEDNSTDGTRSKVEQLQDKYNFTVHYNMERVESPLANFAKGIEVMKGDGEDILVTVDADDITGTFQVGQYISDSSSVLPRNTQITNISGTTTLTITYTNLNQVLLYYMHKTN